MTTKDANVLTHAQRKFLERWTIGAATAYSFIMIGALALFLTSSASDDNVAEQPGIAAQTSFQSASQQTDGHNKAAADRTMPEAAMRTAPAAERDELKDDVRLPAGASWAVPPTQAARVPVPEVDELGEAPMWPGDVASSLAARARSAAAPQGEALAENAWDFEKPETIPGFGAIVEHDTTPDGQRLTARQNPVTNR